MKPRKKCGNSVPSRSRQTTPLTKLRCPDTGSDLRTLRRCRSDTNIPL